MWKCPVCDKENQKPVCIECSFDSSTDLEHNPTLTTVGEVVAVSKRREQFQAERENLFICPECHGCYFKVNSADQTLICGNCATIVPVKLTIQIPAKNASVSQSGNLDKQMKSSNSSTASQDYWSLCDDCRNTCKSPYVTACPRHTSRWWQY